MARLFEPITIKNTRLKNRIGVSPMCQYSYQDGKANDWLLTHLGSRAVGGAGLILTEATAVEPRGRISPFDLGIWDDHQIQPLKRVVDFLVSQGAIAGIQLAHAGRKACTHPPFEGGKPYSEGHPLFCEAVAPSAIPFSQDHQTPIELTDEEIIIIKQAFRSAALRSQAAGFKWLEIHAAHGYLIHSFLSPITNQRTDRYGGEFKNRIRFLIEVIESVQTVWHQDDPISVRISATDWVEGGWSIDDSIKLSEILRSLGVDLIDCSSGGIRPGIHIPVHAGYQVPIAAQIRNSAKIMTAAVGLITEAHQAEEILKEGKADLVLLGREFLRNPYWTLYAAKKLGVETPIVNQYERAF